MSEKKLRPIKKSKAPALPGIEERGSTTVDNHCSHCGKVHQMPKQVTRHDGKAINCPHCKKSNVVCIVAKDDGDGYEASWSKPSKAKPKKVKAVAAPVQSAETDASAAKLFDLAGAEAMHVDDVAKDEALLAKIDLTVAEVEGAIVGHARAMERADREALKVRVDRLNAARGYGQQAPAEAPKPPTPAAPKAKAESPKPQTSLEDMLAAWADED